jgi:hypothetical protein
VRGEALLVKEAWNEAGTSMELVGMHRLMLATSLHSFIKTHGAI